MARKSSMISTRSLLVRWRGEIATVLSVCLVNEYTVADSRFSVRVRDWCLRAKITGTPRFRPVMIAGAMPEASMVTILVMPESLNSVANSSPISFIRAGSIWWFRKASTFRTWSESTMPSSRIFLCRASMKLSSVGALCALRF
ncbi:hypothetical protein D3C80_1497680 [compost metagenome]